MSVTVTGTWQVGNTLTAVGGTSPYQWYREGNAISGATSSTYLLANADQGCWIQVLSGGVYSPFVKTVRGTTIRYVSMVDGLDTNDGTTPNAGAPHGPWKTLAHVNAQTFTAGTTILFRRGDTWRTDGCSTSSGAQLRPSSSGTAGVPIVFDAYDGTSGKDPVIDGSIDLSLTTHWQLTTTANVWESVHTFNGFGHANGLPNFQADDPGQLIWGISEVGGTNVPAGLKNASYGVMTGTGTNGVWYKSGEGQTALDAAGEWNFNTDTNKIQVYCTTNPATGLPGVTSDLRAAIDTSPIYFNAQSNIIIQSFILKFCAAPGVETGSDGGGTCNNIIVRDCIIQWIGGGNNNGSSDANSRYGDGMDVQGGCTGMLMERCWLHQVYDNGPIAPQCTGPHQDNITMRNCVVTDCGKFYQSFFLGGVPTAAGLAIYNNTVYLTEKGWADYPLPGQRPNSLNIIGLGIDTVDYNSTTHVTTVQSNMYVANNIFAGIGGPGSIPGFGIDGTAWNVGGGVNLSNPYTASGPMGTGAWLDYNCWPKNIGTGNNQRIALSNGNFDISNWVQGTNIGGAGTFTPALEVHGKMNVDPVFVSQTAMNFALQSTSPCLTAGVNLFSNTTVPVPSNAAPGVVWNYQKSPRPTTGAFSMGAF